MSSAATAPTVKPRFSIVSAVYNVARYLEEFIDSVEAQTFGLDQVEVIVVNDGSTDESLEVVRAWQRRRPELVTVVSKPNGGLSSARNAGLEHVRGEWVTFTDPDDVLDAGYLAEVDAVLRKHPETVLVATNRVVFNDTTREQSRHPLHRHFTKDNRLRNLDYDTGHFHGHAASSFFRLDAVQRDKLRFDERLRATFEDGHFCCDYLLRAAEPLVAYVTTAVYNYRRRDDGSSQLGRSWADAGRFTDVIEHGYLWLLREASARCGRVPTWLQGMVIYELSWYFKTADMLFAQTAGSGAVARRFHELMTEICRHLDDAGIDGYSATRLKPIWRDTLRHGYGSEPWHTTFAVVDKLDPRQNLMRVSYRFTGDIPAEEFIVYGKPVEPVHQKIRDVQFFERAVLQERIAWLPFGTLRVVLDGRDVDARMSEPEPPSHHLIGWAIQQRFDPDAPAAEKPAKPKPSLTDQAILRLARTRLVRHYLGNSWVLMDRIFNADDSAEHLFRYLRKRRRKINAWFVIERGAPDYRRLRRDGYRRIVPHGSLRWKLLMLSCRHLISTHADHPIIRPAAITKLTEPAWRFTFLQHGVTKDDISTWLNSKKIDIFVTSTAQEQESVVGDHTSYRYTTREAKLTGLPRFDRVLAEGERFPPDKRDLILIAPTWRQWLTSTAPGETGRHIVDVEEFRASDYGKQWTAFVNSPQLREIAERTGLTVALLLHPNLQEQPGLVEIPPHVRSFGFEGQNAQELFARARVLVTDYSSMFFNAAYIERPVVYFQFDRDRVLTGWHLGRRGYFDYERDGYGPVTLSVDNAVTAVIKAIDHGPQPEPEYLRRIQASFPQRDGRCCERVADVIAKSTQPVRSRGLEGRRAPMPVEESADQSADPAVAAMSRAETEA